MQELRLADWTQQLAGLVVLASCAAMARASKPKVNNPTGSCGASVGEGTGHPTLAIHPASKLDGYSRSFSIDALPAVAGAGKLVAPKTRKKKDNLSPEVREFMQLPPLIQRQVLEYARNWISSNFEPAK